MAAPFGVGSDGGDVSLVELSVRESAGGGLSCGRAMEVGWKPKPALWTLQA